ncbi:MAG: PQQ-binding-like beta-propeller repeat protein [Acidobacteriota bacterium]
MRRLTPARRLRSVPAARRTLLWFASLSVALALAPAALADGDAATLDTNLLAAARDGDLERAKTLLDAGANVEAAERHGITALLVAAGSGHVEIVRLLVERGADIHARERFWGTTVLGRLIGGGEWDTARWLAGLGAQADTRQLMTAVSSGPPDLVKVLLEARETVYAYERDDALAMARAASSEDLVTILGSLEVAEGVPAYPLSPSDLEAHTGVYDGALAGGDAAHSARVEAVDGGLLVHRPGAEPRRYVPVEAHHFRSTPRTDSGLFILSRAGLVDGVVVVDRGAAPIMLRRDEDAALDIAPRAADAREPGDSGAPAKRGPARPWPSFRGASADGIGDGQGAVGSWDLESGENVRWSTPIPGLGNSSPVVWGDRILLTTAVAEGGDSGLQTGFYGSPGEAEEDTPHDWLLLAIDAADGTVLWQRSAGSARPLSQRHLKSSQANSTPVTDGERVVAVFPTAGLVCHRASDGELLWRRDLGALSSGNSDKVFQWGFASSPILWRGLVILQVDIHDGSYLAAFDLETGDERWRTGRDEVSTWATPLVVEVGDRAELVTNGTTVRGYDPKTGEELWTLGPNSEIVIATPIFAHGLIFVTAGYPPVRTIYAIRPGQKGDLTLPEGERSSDAIAWSHHRGGGYMPTPIIVGDLLYLPHHNGRLVAYDAHTGAPVFRARFSRRGTLTGSPVAADGRLYFTTEEGLVYVVQAGSTYRELGIHDMGEPLMTTPAISDGAIYLRGQRHLWALGAPPAGSEPTSPGAP